MIANLKPERHAFSMSGIGDALELELLLELTAELLDTRLLELTIELLDTRLLELTIELLEGLGLCEPLDKDVLDSTKSAPVPPHPVPTYVPPR